ncbi:MAG: YqgE/AlgH family protein [Proteobacteria bacterium]|nr:YqgE/AlgH family protein [Pseudomonadota bacterium]
MNIEDIRNSGLPGQLDGQMLIAMPGMDDPRFARSVVYLCAHSEDGAMGIIVNRRTRNLAMADLLVQIGVITREESRGLPTHVLELPVLYGGPVETSRGFVLHSTDFIVENSTLLIAGNVGLTVTMDILKALSRGEGPESAVLALGYASWSAGQLEREMATNVWLNGMPDDDIILGLDLESKYDRALGLIGIDPTFLSQEAGRA